ncbi:hypothetical protein D9M71_787250 [compost metagenome]
MFSLTAALHVLKHPLRALGQHLKNVIAVAMRSAGQHHREDTVQRLDTSVLVK